MTWPQRTNKLETICGILKSHGVKCSIEHPGYIHAETLFDEELTIASGFDGATMEYRSLVEALADGRFDS